MFKTNKIKNLHKIIKIIKNKDNNKIIKNKDNNKIRDHRNLKDNNKIKDLRKDNKKNNNNQIVVENVKQVLKIMIVKKNLN